MPAHAVDEIFRAGSKLDYRSGWERPKGLGCGGEFDLLNGCPRTRARPLPSFPSASQDRAPTARSRIADRESVRENAACPVHWLSPFRSVPAWALPLFPQVKKGV